MNAFFADTFCWIAFTNVQDLAHGRVKAFTRHPKSLVHDLEKVVCVF